MLNGHVRPSTLEGVKRLATQIKKEQGVKHANALDLAAQAANCANYRHALRVLPSNGEVQQRHMVLLTVYWHDQDSHQQGRETLGVSFSRAILEIATKPDFRYMRGLATMRMVASDHLVSDSLAHSQDYARRAICQAERSLRFMEHTGLRPARSQDVTSFNKPGDKLPHADHTTHWVDPVNGQLILVDEPYGNASLEQERQAWARQQGWHLSKSTWPGMYLPYLADFYVATDASRGYDFEVLMTKINAIPAPIVEENWAGDSVPSLDVFVSPAAKTPQDRRRARSKAIVMPRASATTIPYVSMWGNSRRRPAGAMPVAQHIEAGRIIKAVLHSSVRHNVYQKMSSLRSTLEDWLALEVGSGQIEGMDITDVYYHDVGNEGPYVEAAQSSPGLIRMLGELKQKLQAAYPDCAPLREQLHRIDMSVSLITKLSAEAR